MLKYSFTKIDLVAMTDNIFGSLFTHQDTRLDLLGDPLQGLLKTIDWEQFREQLNQIQSRAGKSNAGAPRKDVVMMFKGLVIQDLYGLSDDQLEFQLEDRRSFQRFLGLESHHRVPDAKTFWAYRERLTERELIKPLFDLFSKQLASMGYKARKGQLIDASIIPVPIQRNTREENAIIKQEAIPIGWSNQSKRSQKDTDARWTRKNGKSHYGYKNHINIDNENKVIRDYGVTDASVHDSQVFEDILDASNSNKDVWADSAYRSSGQEASLKRQGYRSKIQRKGKRGKPLTQWERQGNRTRSKVRSRVEHVFGAQSNLRNKAIRCIGISRAQTEIGLMNIVYNMRRLCFLERGVVS